MPFPPSKKTFEGLIDDILTRLNLVERRLAIRGNASSDTGSGAPQSAQLAGSYDGRGPAMIVIPGDPERTVPASWATTYVPNLSRSVSVVWHDNHWMILGQTDMNRDGSGFYPITLASNWTGYSRVQMDRQWNSRIGATRLPTGLVVLNGLLRSIGTPAQDTPVGTLPPECRPEHEVLLSVEAGDVAKAIHIHPTTGVVTCIGTGWQNNQYLNLDGVAFWGKDSEATGNWISVGQGGSSFGANFEANAAWSNYGVPAFYVDRYGMTWFRGLARIKVATSADNTNIITLPTNARGNAEHHMRGTGSHFGFSGFGARTTDGLNWKSGGGNPGTVGAYLSLTGPVIVTPSALTLNTWARPALLNNWVNYSAQFTQFGFTRRGDGLVKFQGLVRAGSASGATISNLATYPEVWPREHRIILSTLAAPVARARIDISGHDEDGGRTPLDVVPVSGASTDWTSLDALMYVP